MASWLIRKEALQARIGMILAVARILVMAFGAAICVLSAWGVFVPAKLIRFVREVMDRDTGIYAAIAARLLLGLALILSAETSRFPLGFRVLGWIAIAAAAGVAMIGRERLQRLAAWFDRFPPAFVRLWLLLGLVFGGFLVYGSS